MLFGKEKNILKEKEAKYKIALSFVEHLKLLLSKTDGKNNSIQITLSELYENYEYPDIESDYWQRDINYAEQEQAHSYAQLEGMIIIDKSVRPNRYSINENNLYLRPYQKFIIDKVKKRRGSVLIEAPTGSGKSVIASNIAKNEIERGGKVLIVAPKIILLKQLQETFSELNPSIIHGAKDYDNEHNVFISTIQTAHKRDLGFTPTMILIDEVHFGFDGKMIENLLEDFEGRLIGLSATPYDRQGKILEGFDEHIDNFDLEYMIKNDYLHEPKCYSPIKVDLSNISIIAGDYNQKELNTRFNTKDDIYKVINATKDVILNRKASLIFCINILHAEAIAAVYNDVGITTRAIHSNLSQAEQVEIMNDFKSGKIKLLANPMLLTTGFDYPATDTIILARPTKSQNLFRQMVGRGLRLSDNKKDALVLDCAGIISDLGFPTEKIQEVKNNVSLKNTCKECGSDKLYKVVFNNKTYLRCAECGDEKEIKQKGYECPTCKFINASNLVFYTKHKCLYTKCTECNEEIFINSSSTQEELKEIFDDQYIDKIQKKITLEYVDYLMNSKRATFIANEKVFLHIKALQRLISKNPELFIKFDKERYKKFRVEYKDDTYSWESYSGEYNENDSWRIFDQKLEDYILYFEEQKLLDFIKSSNDTFETIKLIQQLYKIIEKKEIPSNLINRIAESMKNSKIKDINEICNKRIKSIFEDGKDFSEMIDFIKLMESVL